MPQRHIVYCKNTVASVTPEILLQNLKVMDYLTLGEDYGLSEEAVRKALPLRVKNISPPAFHNYHLTYGDPELRPITIERWESEDQRRAAVDERIANLTISEKTRTERITKFLRDTCDSVSVSFGTDPAAAMYAWEVVRYFASEFKGLVHTDDGEWLTIDADYQAEPI